MKSPTRGLDVLPAAISAASIKVPAVARLSTLVLLSFSACALCSTHQSKTEKQIDRAVAVLAQRTDADSLAAAGLLSIDDHKAEPLSLLARAAAAAPDRPDLLWLQVSRCFRSPACDPEPIERRLREIDPANGASWWGLLARAGAAHDSERANDALTAIGRSERIDIYWTTLIAHLARAVAKTKEMSVRESEVTVIGYLAALPIPPLQYASAGCKGDALQQPRVTDICRGVARAFQNGDTYMIEMVGVNIAKHVWPEESAEWKAADSQRRVYDYRSKLYKELERHALNHPDDYLALCEQNQRESGLFAALIVAAGYDPNPPAE
jgi:hypothetical protein